MMEAPNTNDIRAAIDVINQITEISDTLAVDRAIELQEALRELIKAAQGAISLLDTQVKAKLERSAQIVGTKAYAVKPTGKWRPDHGKLKGRLAMLVRFDPVTGAKRSKLTIEQAVDRTVDLMYKLYVAPAAVPKQGGLKELGLQLSDFCVWEKTGSEVVSMDLSGADDEP
jgi:hypothetical protein